MFVYWPLRVGAPHHVGESVDPQPTFSCIRFLFSVITEFSFQQPLALFGSMALFLVVAVSYGSHLIIFFRVLVCWCGFLSHWVVGSFLFFFFRLFRFSSWSVFYFMYLIIFGSLSHLFFFSFPVNFVSPIHLIFFFLFFFFSGCIICLQSTCVPLLFTDGKLYNVMRDMKGNLLYISLIGDIRDSSSSS